MKNVHMTLQGKGGVGKSLVSALLAQYLIEKGEPVRVVDTDPVNMTLAGFEAFKATRLNLMDGGTLIERNFDKLIEQILEDESHFVVDNGASSFIPLSYYMAENDAFSVLEENDRHVIIHSVITGGQAQADTVHGFNELARQLPEGPEIVVWLNEYFGEIDADGKSFEQMKAYQQNKDKVRGIVRIPRQTGSTFGEDIKQMLESKLTFAEVAQSEAFGLMAKARLAKVRKTIFDSLAAVPVL
ncbi:P-loop NTPase [Shinella yambaruensis]|uniref:CobQ/CobB/MinD/ParA nucleotide binding domain-containing protein n=1 Tax=Shinella yambaruensis TaxID=415996 RepID=A0ABQ5ZTC5_9HYPH|nr:P-loop NTPase [Shinella yambaruensis]MCJ8029950.1 P-loop NTPase [Shinella yambaruensis]MCU7984209.1 P-loop NTPase [Shinella yambaruensis]GLR55197.1 hypothetical protein GCM10007923_64190 [Shinella yambaruensis]